MMLASMQLLAKKPSSLETYGAVCTAFGGATDTPILILRMVGQFGAFCASASLAPSATQAASGSSVVQRFDMIWFPSLVSAPTASLVIPGRREATSPESITTVCEYGFRAPSLRSGPGMTAEGAYSNPQGSRH